MSRGDGYDEDARALILGSSITQHSSRNVDSPETTEQCEKGTGASAGYSPLQVSHYYRRPLTIYAKHIGVSLLLDATFSKPDPFSDDVQRQQRRGTRPAEFLRDHMRWRDVELRKEEINRAFFLKRTSYAKAKEEHLEKIRANLATERAVEETHAPVISAYAKQSSAPKGINDFFPRGMEWKKSREKKLKAKREKIAAEAAEEEAEHFVRWKLSEENRRILAEVAARREAEKRRQQALEDGDDEDGNSVPLDGSGHRQAPRSENSLRTSATSQSPMRTHGSSFELRSDHHHPCLSSRSRELTKDLPPFEYRMQVALERKKTRTLEAAFQAQQRELQPEGIEEVRQGPTLPEKEIRVMIDRLHRSPRSTPQRDAECTFRPEVNHISAFEHVSPRVYSSTPRKRPLTAAVLSAVSRSSPSVDDDDAVGSTLRTNDQSETFRHSASSRAEPLHSSTPRAGNVSPFRRAAANNATTTAADVGTAAPDEDSFLLRTSVWARVAAQHRASDVAKAEQRFAATHSFHPRVCPVSSRIVRASSSLQRRTAPSDVGSAIQIPNDRWRNWDSEDVFWEKASPLSSSARELSYSPMRRNATGRGGTHDDAQNTGRTSFGCNTIRTNAPPPPPTGSPDALQYLLRFGLHGKPPESPRRSDFRQHSEPPRGSSRSRADVARSHPQPLQLQRVQRAPVINGATSSPSTISSRSNREVDRGDIPLSKDVVNELFDWWRRMANLSDDSSIDGSTVTLPRDVVLACIEHVAESIGLPVPASTSAASGSDSAPSRRALVPQLTTTYVSFPQFVAAVSDVLVSN